MLRRYVHQQVAPTLRPGDIVVMDNPGSHKSTAVRQAIAAAVLLEAAKLSRPAAHCATDQLINFVAGPQDLYVGA
jgi:hypothetical protein